MKRFIISIICATVFFSFVKAQEKATNILVVDELNNPIPEVTVTINGIILGVDLKTDQKGLIQIETKKGDILNLSLFNKLVRKVEATGKNMQIRLGRNNRIYDLGYDEKVTKETSSAAISGVSSTEIESSSQYNVMNNLYGLIPGLAIYQAENQPWNANPTLYVRGQGSFGGNKVIVLVDGVERDISIIDRKEIESVTVLKDAATLALYGNRGADGVVSLTTKRGGTHSLRSKIDYTLGVLTPFRIPKMADAVNYASALNEALENDGLSPKYTESDIQAMLHGEKNNVLPRVNWEDRILRKSNFNHDLNLSFDGKHQRMRYYVFANYTGNSGLFNNASLNEGYTTQLRMDALKLRTNLEAAITPFTVARMNLMGRLLQYNQPAEGTDLTQMYNTPSTGFPIKNGNGIWSSSQLFPNPLAEKTAKGYTKMLQRTLFADITIDQNLSMLTPGLSAQVKIAYDNSAHIGDAYRKEYQYAYISPVYDQTGNIVANDYSTYGNNTELGFYYSLSWQVMCTTIWGKMNYEKSFGKHQLKGAAIYSQNRTEYTAANSTFMYRDYIANIDYNYDNRYILNGVLTYGGSAKLTKGDKYRLYPAISGAWIISNEDFMKNQSVIDFMKLRASYGVSGMDYRLSYDMDKQFNGTGNNYIFVGTVHQGGYKQGSIPSKNIEPEKDYKTNIGLEVGLLKGLTFEIDGFYNNRKNIRVSSAGYISSVIGRGVPDVFKGETENYGVEVALGWKQAVKDFNYSIQGNISYSKNKIINMEEEYQPHPYMRQTGNSIGTFYGLVADGLYQEDDFDSNGSLKEGLPISSFISSVQPGDVKYKDLNNDGRIDEYDNTYQLRSNLPEIYYGINLSLSYKNFGINALFQGTARSTVTTTLASIYQPLYGNNKNISDFYLENRWTEYTPDNRFPRLTTLANDNNYRTSSLWTQRGDFFKLRNLEIYYKIPSVFIQKLRIDECRIFAKGMNLFSIDHVGIMDPEYISTGYPSVRSYLLGLNIMF